MTNSRMSGRTLGLALTLAAAPVSAAMAQGAASHGLELQEVVVTAQKRSENLQDVPIAVAAVTSAAIENGGLRTTKDIQFAVPSLVYTQSGGWAQPYLRGVGSDQTLPNADPEVATYVDGIFVASNFASIQALLGVDRVEVLLGPQGTLYGRNSVGGAINLYTLTPQHEMQGKATLTAGNYNRKEASGYVSGGLSDTLAVGLYGGYSRRQTYLVKVRNNGETDHETQWGVRAKAVWTPTDDLKFTGSIERAGSDSFESGAYRNIQPNALGYALGAPVLIGNYLIASNYRQEIDFRQTAAVLRGEYDMGGAVLMALTGYRKMKDPYQANDVDGTTANLLQAQASTHAKQFSQELQIQSPVGSPVTWIAGAYYLDQTAGYDYVATIGAALGARAGVPVGGSFRIAETRVKSYSGFAQATVPLDFIAEGVRLTVGGRYTSDHVTMPSATTWVTQTDLTTVFPGTTVNYPVRRATFNKFTPKVTLDYKIGDALIYATFSKGYKSGVFNLSAPQSPGPVRPENLTAYELGNKVEFMNGRVRLNSAGYYYNFKDIQVTQYNLAAGAGTTLQNAAVAHIYGIEGSLSAVVTRDLSVALNASYNHARYKRFQAANGVTPGPAGNPAAPVDVSGNAMTRAPKWVLSANADYHYPLANGGSVDASANWYYNGGFYWDVTNRYKESAYDVLNVKLGYTFPDEKLSASVWATNLTNSHYRRTLGLFPTSISVQDNEPRMYGVTLAAKF